MGIGVLLYKLRNRSREERALAIHHLRTTIREEFQDIRNNTIVGKAMWIIINELTQNHTSSLAYRDSGRSRRKRKADEGTDEYRPEPIKTLGKGVKTRSKITKM